MCQVQALLNEIAALGDDDAVGEAVLEIMRTDDPAKVGCQDWKEWLFFHADRESILERVRDIMAAVKPDHICTDSQPA